MLEIEAIGRVVLDEGGRKQMLKAELQARVAVQVVAAVVGRGLAWAIEGRGWVPVRAAPAGGVVGSVAAVLPVDGGGRAWIASEGREGRERGKLRARVSKGLSGRRVGCPQSLGRGYRFTCVGSVGRFVDDGRGRRWQIVRELGGRSGLMQHSAGSQEPRSRKHKLSGCWTGLVAGGLQGQMAIRKQRTRAKRPVVPEGLEGLGVLRVPGAGKVTLDAI